MNVDTGIVNRRQFILTNFYSEVDGFKCEKFYGYFFCYQEDLKRSYICDRYGKKWILLGEAYSVKEKGSTPEKELKETEFKSVEDVYFFWTGRWCLIGDGEVHTDATGMMSLYYYVSKGERWIVSPSLNLVYSSFREDFVGFKQKMIPNASIDWYPAPLTKVRNVYRTFNSQKLSIFETGIKTSYRDVINYQFSKLSDEDKRVRLTNYLCNAVYNVSKFSGRKIWMALTAGTDSRIVLAALLKMGIDFSTYTFDHEAISNGDKNIPFELAKRFGFNHKLIKRTENKPNIAWMRKYDEHTFYNIDDADRKFYGYGQYAQIPDDVITIKSVFEICRGFYYEKIKTPNGFKRKIKEYYPDIVSHSSYEESIDLWFNWAERHKNHMDIRDRFYMEQRIGGWLSTLQQSLDMFPMTQILITNSAAILSSGYWYSQEEKEKNRIVYEQIENMKSELLDIPMNPPEYWFIIKICIKKSFKHPIVTSKKVLKRIEGRLSGRN